MSAGYVYILTSEAHPNTLKIGHTTRTVEERRRELSRQTGVLYEFQAVHSESVPNSERAEKLIHKALRSYRVRKEFFKVSLDVARLVVTRIAEQLRNEHQPKPRPAVPTASPKQQSASLPQPVAKPATQSDDAPKPVSYEKSVARMLAERRDQQRRMQQWYWLLLGTMIFVACAGLIALLVHARKAPPSRSAPPPPLKRALR